MSFTPNLTMPYLLPAQAQKHVTYNQALQTLDALLHLSVESASIIDPPSLLQEGERYLVPIGASGDWATLIGKVAVYLDGAWHSLTPRQGWIAHIRDEAALRSFRWSRLDRYHQLRTEFRWDRHQYGDRSEQSPFCDG